MSMRASASDLPIRFEQVTVSSRSVVILDCITLQIESGAPTVLIGPNGSGKTTLLRTAMGLLAPTLGRINALRSFSARASASTPPVTSPSSTHQKDDQRWLNRNADAKRNTSPH